LNFTKRLFKLYSKPFQLPLNLLKGTLKLAINSEVVSLNEIFTDGNRGLEIGISYNSAEFPYYSFIRYYFINDNFVAFTWTGEKSILRNTMNNSNKNIFFNSVKFE